MLVDTHAHIVAEAFDDDRDAVIRRAKEAGVGAIVCIGDSPSASQKAANLARATEGIWATAGIHPHQAVEAPDDVRASLLPFYRQDKVVAVGEVGLDYHYDFAPVDIQQRIFREQIRLACEVGLPLIIHNRESDDDVVRILKEEDARQVGGVFHCFWADAETAKAALEMGFYLGVGGPVTFKNTDDLRSILKEIPLDRLLVETDSPYLAPVPNRGKRNEPAFVVETARALAELKGVDEDEIAAVTYENAKRLFGLR